MPGTLPQGLEALVLVDDTNGVTVIPQLSELRRLNWFDGKLLRADDLRVEQDHVRALVRRANRGGGYGAVHGMSCTLSADGSLHVGSGMAIDPGGRSLLLPLDVALDVQQLIDRTAAVAKAGAAAGGGPAGFGECVEPQVAGQAPIGGGRWYVVTVGWAEGLCGQEDVFGNLCEDACTTSTDRPWRLDGLVFRARPAQPLTPLVASGAVALGAKHERSLLASALFADERAAAGSLISGAGLRSPIWCMGAAPADPVFDEVPLAVIGRQGATTTFLDVWTARRERIEPPPRRYWAGRMAMRPWDVFLAQVLQFQCQLSDLVDDAPPAEGTDPCAERQRVLEAAIDELENRTAKNATGADDVLELLKTQMLSLRVVAAPRADRVLVDGGIVELPPAGYLPVEPAGPRSVEDQVRALVGAGVDLTFCTTRADAVARALEEAQHLDRISLLRGLDDPAQREDVQIIVPDGQLRTIPSREGWDGRLSMLDDTFGEIAGAGRIELLDGLAVRWAGRGSADSEEEPSRDGSSEGFTPRQSSSSRRLGAPAVRLEASVDRDPFKLLQDGAVTFSASGDVAFPPSNEALRATVHGRFRIGSIEQRLQLGPILRGTIDAIAVARAAKDDDDEGDLLRLDRAPATLAMHTATDGTATVRLRVLVDRKHKRELTVDLTWRGQADSVQVVASRSASGTAILDPGILDRAVGVNTVENARVKSGDALASLRLQRDAEAVVAGSRLRTASERALSALEKAFEDPDYADEAGARLFPAGDRGLRLIATRDWVLFRRRAPLECGAPAEAPVTTDRFAVYGLVDVGTENPVVFLGEVRFRPGSAELAGGSESVAGAWGEIASGGTLVAARVVEGSPGGDELGLARAGRLVAELAGVTPAESDLKPAAVDPDAFGLDPRGSDGVMLVSARPAVVEVAVVTMSSSQVSPFRGAMVDGRRPAALVDAFKSPHVLGTIRFPADGAEPIDEEDLSKILLAYGELFGSLRTARVDLFSAAGDKAAGLTELREARATRIASSVQADPETSVWEVETNDLKPARENDVTQSAFVVLTPDLTVTARVLAVPSNQSSEFAALIKGKTFPAAVALAVNVSLGPIAFDANAAKPQNANAIKLVQDAYRKQFAHGDVARIAVLTAAEDENPTADAVAKERATAVAAGMGGFQQLQRVVVPASALASKGITERTLIVLVETDHTPR